jgi:integrase
LAPYPGLVARPGRRTRYYLDLAGRRIPLGTDLAAAIAAWHRLTQGEAGAATLAAVSARYRAEELPAKSRATQQAYGHHLDRLEEAFGHALLEEIEPKHLAEYYRLRSRKASAAIELDVFSALWAWAAARGYVSAPNPRHVLRIARPKARTRYVTDAEYRRIWTAADEWTRDAMDLALLTGQRPGDVLSWRLQDLVDGHIEVLQGKTGKRLRIAVVGELAQLVERIRARPRPISGGWLVQDRSGQRISVARLRRHFQDAAAAAAVSGVQVRDLRAKSASDSETLAAAQERLGHESASMTARVYRRGQKVTPLR